MSIIHTKISALLNSLNSQTLLLPEIQRDFVWTKPRIIALLDSLFQNFPIGSMLIWKTQSAMDKVHTKKMDVPTFKLQSSGELIYGYLLDGQQRLTSLLKTLNDEEIPIRFHLIDGTFEIENRRNRKNPLYIIVTDALKERIQITDLLTELKEAKLLKDNKTEQIILKNYLELTQILNRDVAILQYSSDSYSNATKLFIRFNSGGVKLKQSELAIAELAQMAPSIVGNHMRKFSTGWQNKGYAFTIPFLARCLATIKTDSVRFTNPTAIWKAKDREIWEYWNKTQKAIEKTISFISGTMHWDSTSWLTSYNALIPIIYIFGKRKSNKQFSSKERKLLRKWLSLVTLRGRYSGAAESKLEMDIRKIKKAYSPKQLWSILSKNDRRKITLVEIQEASRSGSLMSIYYSMLKEKSAIDWINGTKIDGNILGFNSSLEIHHIFPTSLLYKEDWDTDWINSFANFALLQKGSNIEIGNKMPKEYLGIGKKFKDQCIPSDKKLWHIDSFEDFSNARERLLQKNLNSFLNL